MKSSALLLALLAQSHIINGATTVVAITSTLVVTLSTTLVIPDLPSTSASVVTSDVTSSTSMVTDSTSASISVSSAAGSAPISTSSASTDEDAGSESTTASSLPSETFSPTVSLITTSTSGSATVITPGDETDSSSVTSPEPTLDPTPTVTESTSNSITDMASPAPTDVALTSISASASDSASETTSSAEASSTALPPGLRLQVSGGDFDGYYIGNDDPSGGFGVASLYMDPRDGDVFTTDLQETLISTDGSTPNYANQDMDVPSQPIYFNSATALESFMEVVYLECLFSGEFLTCTSGQRSTFVACNPGIYSSDTPTLYLNIADRVDDGCSVVTIRVVTF